MIFTSTHAAPSAPGDFSSYNLEKFDFKYFKEQEFHVSHRTLFLIDYDDTVLASTWLESHGLTLESEIIPEAVSRELSILERSATELLSRALSLGKVVVVTNAEAGWVELSAAKFLPGLIPLLDRIRVISARTAFEKKYPRQIQLWKNAAYDQVFEETFKNASDNDYEGPFNVLSFGDSLYERNALLQLSEKKHFAMLGKSIKLIERPSVEQLQRQLQILVSNIYALTVVRESVDIMLTVEYT